ncbi:MAG: hypothetical protein WBC19_00455 [Pyrinomonadaceae bacterium]|nr:hypothetical protein [Chloracidobacterium sp.]
MMRLFRIGLYTLFISVAAINTFAGVVVQGRPDMIEHAPSKENGNKFSWQVSLQITCAGAASPRIGYGPTRLYYAAPFEKDGSLVEFTPGRSFGYGESDKSSVTLLSNEFTEGGARVFPMTEFIRCDDRDNTSGSMMVKDIKGTARKLSPGISYLNNLRFARPSDNPKLDPNDKRFAEDTDLEFDRDHIPAGKFVLQCVLLNIDPKEKESFELILRSSAAESLIRSYSEKDQKASCEVFALERPGQYEFSLRWQPYNVGSWPISLTAVGK